jgi:hypothetical protein
MPRLYAWLAALSLLSLGSLAAHSLAYRAVEPGEHVRSQLLESTGHGYLAAVPYVAGACLAVTLAALAAVAARAWRGARSAPPEWPIALVPLLGYGLQEYLERALAGADWIATATEPTFLVGLALQLPFALLTLGIARRLTAIAETVGRSLAPAPPGARPGLVLAVPRPTETVLAPARALALGYAKRGPPS